MSGYEDYTNVAAIVDPKNIWKRILNLSTDLDTSSIQWKIKSNSRHLEMTFLGWPPSLLFPSLAILESTWQQVVSDGFNALPNSLFYNLGKPLGRVSYNFSLRWSQRENSAATGKSCPFDWSPGSHNFWAVEFLRWWYLKAQWYETCPGGFLDLIRRIHHCIKATPTTCSKVQWPLCQVVCKIEEVVMVARDHLKNVMS
jgi:hypothetical protein